MKRLLILYAIAAICAIILATFAYRWSERRMREEGLSFSAGDHEWPSNPFPLEERGWKWAECNRRIRDQEYIAGAWYRTEDPNVTVYLDLIEQAGWDAPVLYYSASDPNATIWTYQQLLMNTSGGPIRWGEYHSVPRHGPYDFPKADPNDYARFLDKKITFYDGWREYDISKDAPVTVR